jgi:hypothetical protein
VKLEGNLEKDRIMEITSSGIKMDARMSGGDHQSANFSHGRFTQIEERFLRAG